MMDIVMMIGTVIILIALWRLVKWTYNKQTNRLTDDETAVQTDSRDKPGRMGIANNRFYRGEIVFYDELKRFGFIRQKHAKGDKIFFHASAVKRSENITVGQKVKYMVVDTERGLKAIKISLMGNCIDNSCIESKGQKELRLHGLDCIKTEDKGCVTLQNFRLSLHLYECYIDGDIDLDEIYQHISCRCQTNNIVH